MRAAISRSFQIIPRQVAWNEWGRCFPRILYKVRARIQRTKRGLKRVKGLRCDETKAPFVALAGVACSIMLTNSVYTSW